MSSERYNEEVTRIIEDRITTLLTMKFSEAADIPEASAESINVAGEMASLTTFRQYSPHQLEGNVLVTILVAKPRWFGLASNHIERGLVFSPNNEVREATEIELQNSGG